MGNKLNINSFLLRTIFLLREEVECGIPGIRFTNDTSPPQAMLKYNLMGLKNNRIYMALVIVIRCHHIYMVYI